MHSQVHNQHTFQSHSNRNNSSCVSGFVMETDFSRHGILPYFFPSTTPTARRPFQSKFKIINIYFFMIIWSNLRLNTFANSMLSHHHPKQYHCSHIHPKHHETGHIHLEPEHVLRKRAVSVNLR